MDDDSPETVTAGVTLGLQHPPCYPLDALLNRVIHLLPIGGACFRANTGSALCGAAGVVLTALLLRLVLTRFLGVPSSATAKKIWPCVASASLILAFSKTYWEKAVSAKGGLYLVEMVLILGILLCLAQFEARKLSNFRQKFWIEGAFFLFGLGLAHYWETQILFIPAFLLYFMFARWKPFDFSGFSKKLFRSFGFLVIGISVFALYLPLRAHLQPVLNLGDPENLTYFKMAAMRAYVQGREPNLLAEIARAMTGSGSWEKVRQTWFLMLHIQNVEIPRHFWVDLKLGTLMLALVGLGAWTRAVKGRRTLLFVLVAMVCLVLVFYTALLIPPTVNCRWLVDNYLLPSNWMLALLAGVGLWTLRPFLVQPRSSISPFWNIFKRGLWLAILLGLPLQQLFSNFSMNNEQNQMLRYDYGENLLKSTPRNAVFFAEGDEDYFPLYYFQNVEGQRPDVRMIPAFTLFETWGVAELEHFHPELGLNSASVDFPDHFARIIYSLSEIVAKNRQKDVCVFSYLDGAFHRYYLNSHPQLQIEQSGVALWLYEPPSQKEKCLELAGLRTRHWWDCPSNAHPSLIRIAWVYQHLGLLP
jgi:hypothetical protein